MKRTLLFFFVLINAVAFAQDIEGEWTPDEYCFLGDIRIKHIEGSKYKVRLNTRDGVRTLTATYANGELSGRFEDEDDEYGEFWIGNGSIEKGRKPEILVGHERGSYGTNGAVTGWLGDNTNYHLTRSRSTCATYGKSYVRIFLYFNQKGMTAYHSMRCDYLKNGVPMFYQESGRGTGASYTRW